MFLYQNSNHRKNTYYAKSIPNHLLFIINFDKLIDN